MFENLTVEKSVTYNTVTASEKGNPFSMKAVVAEENGQFKGVSFIEVFKSGAVRPDAQAMCGQYGVVHSLGDQEKEQLDAVCAKLNSAIEDAYGFTFDAMPEPVMEEPTPPAEDPGNEPTAEEGAE